MGCGRRAGAAVALFAASVVVGTTAAGGENDRGYTHAERVTFLDACAAKGMQRSRCDCVFAFISRRVPHDQFAEADRSTDPRTWSPHMRKVTADGLRSCAPRPVSAAA